MLRFWLAIDILRMIFRVRETTAIGRVDLKMVFLFRMMMLQKILALQTLCAWQMMGCEGKQDHKNHIAARQTGGKTGEMFASG